MSVDTPPQPRRRAKDEEDEEGGCSDYLCVQKPLNRGTICGTRVVTAATMLAESVVLNVSAAVVSLVAVEIADFRLSTLMTRTRDWNRPLV